MCDNLKNKHIRLMLFPNTATCCTSYFLQPLLHWDSRLLGYNGNMGFVSVQGSILTSIILNIGPRGNK